MSSFLRAILLMIALPATVLAGLSDTMWVNLYPWTNSNIPHTVTEIHADDSGYVYICGRGQADFVNADMLLAKMNVWGDHLWRVSLGGNTGPSFADIAHGLAVDSVGNVFMAGVTINSSPRFEDMSYCKYSPDSSVLWPAANRKSFWPDEDAAFDIEIGLNSDLYVCGTGYDTTFLLTTFLVMRLDPADGDSIWCHQYVLDSLAFDTREASRARRQSLDRNPDFYEDFTDYDNCANSMAVAPDGGLVVAGFGVDTAGYRWWVMKFDMAGNRLWAWDSSRFNIDLDDVLFDVAIAANGDIYAVGLSEHGSFGYDCAIIRLSPAGAMLGAHYVDGTDHWDDYFTSLALDDSTPQNVYATGCLVNTSGGDQITTFKYSQTLAPRWGGSGALFGVDDDTTSECGYDIDYADGRVYTAGKFGMDAVVLCYTAANATPKDTVWTGTYNGPDSLGDFAAAVCAQDSYRVYFGGQSDYTFWIKGLAGRYCYPDPDVMADAILAPLGVVSPGDTVTPRARIVNVGNYRATVETFMRIGNTYYDSTVTQRLIPGDTAIPTFSLWNVPTTLGTLAIRCSVSYFADNDWSNNVVVDSVIVVRHDVGCARIVMPTGIVDSGTAVVPEAWILNYGTSPESFDCWLSIGGFYSDTVSVIVGAGDSVLQPFLGWIARERGTWPVRCSTMLGSDIDNANDRAVASVSVRVTDMALTMIVTPTDSADSGDIIIPRLLVGNKGSQPDLARFHFLMDDGSMPEAYHESLDIAITGGVDTVLIFPPSAPLRGWGVWWATGWCELVGDMHPENDTLEQPLYVRPPGGGPIWPEGWHEVASVPVPPSGRPVKRGGWLEYMDSDRLIYGAKGYKTNDFYAYSPLADEWSLRTGMPFTKHPVWNDRPPRKGSKGCGDHDEYVYVTQGNNTLGFWRYDVGRDTWVILEDVPYGPSGKKVKGGTDMAYVVKDDVGYVYTLKGYKTEFYRYNISTGQWEQLQDAPAGTRAKWDRGSFVVYDGDRTIYAHKAKYHELWSYDIVRDSWNTEQLTGMPFVGMMGRRRKSKDGGSGAWFDERMWCLKGGNSQEFWVYYPDGDSWVEDDTMPAYGSTGRRKRVKYGADIVAAYYAFWALKGNKTLEFWRYGLRLGATTAQRPTREGVASGDGQPLGWRFELVPNPVTGKAVLEYAVPHALWVEVGVYDPLGRRAGALFTPRMLRGSGALSVDCRELPAGVYLVRIESGVAVWNRKLVVR